MIALQSDIEMAFWKWKMERTNKYMYIDEFEYHGKCLGYRRFASFKIDLYWHVIE